MHNNGEERVVVMATVNLANNYLLKVSNRNTRKRCEKCSKLAIKTERRH